MKKIFISCGEKSGENYAKVLVKEIKKQMPNLHFYGMGGEKLKNEDVNIIESIDPINTVGLIEALKHIPTFFKKLNNIKKFFKTNKINHAIVIDSQGFHVPLLKFLKKQNISSTYFIAPQEWQWGTEKKGKFIYHLCSQILTIFKEEQLFYKKMQCKTTFVGHPILDTVMTTIEKKEFYKEINIHLSQDICAIFPGSRQQEIDKVAPRLIKAAALIQKNTKNLTYIISVSNKDNLEQLEHIAKVNNLNQPIFYFGNSHNLIKYSHISLTTSGTITLEHAILDTPCVVAYAFHPLTYVLARLLFPKLRKQRMSLPNIFLNDDVVPEFLQDNATPENIYHAATLLLKDKENYSYILSKFKEVRLQLGEKGAIKKAAKEIVTFISQKDKTTL